MKIIKEQDLEDLHDMLSDCDGLLGFYMFMDETKEFFEKRGYKIELKPAVHFILPGTGKGSHGDIACGEKNVQPRTRTKEDVTCDDCLAGWQKHLDDMIVPWDGKS